MAIGRWIKGLRENAALRDTAHKMYVTTVNQARSPALFSGLGAPDTLDGRFDLVVLHVGLVLRRLRGCGEGGQKLSEAVFSVFFDDLDQTVREMGVGDMRVGKKVKAMARAFYGRCKVYDEALDAEDVEALVDALRRNIYGPDAARTPAMDVLGRYVRNVVTGLESQGEDAVLSGDISFPPVPGASEQG